MKFMALVSGGKDSFYNVHECLSQGHELVAMANLHPSPERDDIDSFMFQTVGHDIIELYAQCVGAPLYRHQIAGTSANQDLEYRQTDFDEIEDLAQLVGDILLKHPDIKGVSCGAILLQYQRTRVEHVCDRYGLTLLAFLWQRDQKQLLEEMCSNGLDARLIKVAAIGLEPRHLGKSIAEMYPYLVKLNRMYEVHICGEGGEFETLVFDSPVFTKRLELVDSQTVSVPGDVAYLKTRVRVMDKPYQFHKLEAPDLLEEGFVEVLEKVIEEYNSDFLAAGSSSVGLVPDDKPEVPRLFVTTVANNVYICNLALDSPEDLFLQLESVLAALDYSYDNIQHVTLLVSDMSQFTAVNEVYASKFVNHLPPSRVCVQTSLASKFQLSCKLLMEQHTKKGIHIRSRSFWAPQNIGPYSQCRIEESPELSLASISGQIPLVPATMELYDADHLRSTALALQHFHRVKKLVDVQEIANITCFITDAVATLIVASVWKQYCQVFDTDDTLSKLTIVQVERLPRDAVVEWGGDTYKKTETLSEDEEEQENDQKLMDLVKEVFPSASFTKLQRFVQVVLFVDSAADVERFYSQSGIVQHTRIACNFTNFNTIKHFDFEHLPVSKVWNGAANEHQFSIVASIPV